MVRNEKQAREALEKAFCKPFTDYQWSLIAAQGYEEALVSGDRTPAEIAEELRELMQAAGERTVGTEPPPLGHPDEPPLNWDEMERMVLGRILTTGETSGPKPTAEEPGVGVRLQRLAEDRQRSRRLWWIGGLSAVALFALSVGVTVLVLWNPLGGEASRTDITFIPQAVGAGEDGEDSASLSTTTSSSLPPATIPALDVPEYEADLRGWNVVPPAKTAATGTLEVNLAEDGASFEVVVTVKGLPGLTAARLRTGPSGQNGAEILTLYNEGNMKGTLNGVIVRRTFTAANLVGPLKGKTVADFVALADAGLVYVNVGTIRNKDGELRGQLQ